MVRERELGHMSPHWGAADAGATANGPTRDVVHTFPSVPSAIGKASGAVADKPNAHACSVDSSGRSTCDGADGDGNGAMANVDSVEAILRAQESPRTITLPHGEPSNLAARVERSIIATRRHADWGARWRHSARALVNCLLVFYPAALLLTFDLYLHRHGRVVGASQCAVVGRRWWLEFRIVGNLVRAGYDLELP